ncbi:MAG TPA: transglycosylase domain-containing protein [Myxococcota bacterium]|nr:transglycosylase domain-containing protein [Myxococcota bacterium]
MRRILSRVLAAGVVLALLSSVAAVFGYDRYVVEDPGEHLEEAYIRALITQESPVYYRDGRTRLGVFFAEEHRHYVEYEDIPKDWTNAIVSAEDQRYWTHPGVDSVGLARAMIQNVKAGRVVSGGSTLTMQTSENLFHPGTYDLNGKLFEVLDTLRLEAHYSKEDILEFYANQFHVYGNGRGLGIAARYFFDKDVSELSLHECAFLAGLVKIPGRYNPFIGKTDEDRQTARDRAQERTNYVLGRMVIDGHVDAKVAEELYDEPLPFKRGTFRYDSSILMDEVERQLEQEPFPSLLASAGIDNPATSGIQVVTTLDVAAQRGATYGLWHHLSEAGPAMEDLEPTAFIHGAEHAPKPDPNDVPGAREFRYAVVGAHGDEGYELDLGGHPGRLDDVGFERAVKLLAVAQQSNRYPIVNDVTRAKVSDVLTQGAVVWVSVREAKDGVWLCDLEVRPELQGAVVVLEDGRIRAMVGGNDNRNFNRASTARRQLGSTWKILIYDAAFQLGWAPTDALDNRRAVFPFTSTWYYPRPDHKSEDFVSIGWAGVRSENLATIWLLYHLTDRLNPEQVRRLAELTGLSQAEGESRTQYIERIRDDNGVIATRDRIDDALFGAVKEEVIADLAFTGHPEDAVELRSLHYGRGFVAERAKQAEAVRLRALDHNFLRLEAMAEVCREQHEILRSAKGPIDPSLVPDLTVRPTARGFRVNCFTSPEGWAPAGEDLVHRLGAPGLPPVMADPLIDGLLHASTLEATRDAMARKGEQLEIYEPYDPELLYLHPDFRLILGLRYVAGLAREMGVQEEIPPVLSMPLGAIDVSLVEAAGVYQGFLAGEAWRFPGKGFEPGTVPGTRSTFKVPEQEVPALLIAEIRDREGNVIYRADPKAERVADDMAGVLTVDILRNVVQYGTGRRALSVASGFPLGGKTGTTNDYKNAAFVGHAPKANRDDEIHHDRAYTVAAYVGYDDNRKMVRGNIKLQGASGALPAWMGTVQALYDAGLMGNPGELVEPDHTYRAPVVDLSGLPGSAGEERSLLVYGSDGPQRRFAPFAERAETVDAEEEAPPVDLDMPDPSRNEDPWDTGSAEVPRSIWDRIEQEE